MLCGPEATCSAPCDSAEESVQGCVPCQKYQKCYQLLRDDLDDYFIWCPVYFWHVINEGVSYDNDKFIFKKISFLNIVEVAALEQI
jgi:hypothetical protein